MTNLVLKEALRLRELGLAVHWLRPRDKAPVQKDWANCPVPSLEELERTYQSGFNVGFRAGRWSVVSDREVVVLDVDVKDGCYAEEAYAAADVIMAGTFRPHVRSGSGFGRHQFIGFPIGTAPEKSATTVRAADVWIKDGRPCPRTTKGARPAWVIELLSTGKNVVLPPSIHPLTGNPYEYMETY